MHIDIKNESLAADIMRQVAREEEEERQDDEGGHRCEYVGPTGIQCRNMARPGSHYCGIHEQLSQYGELEVSDDPDSLI
jgi:N utilization substance protein A